MPYFFMSLRKYLRSMSASRAAAEMLFSFFLSRFSMYSASKALSQVSSAFLKARSDRAVNLCDLEAFWLV